MLLSGNRIRREMLAGNIIIQGKRLRINPNSVNLTLHNELLAYDRHVLDMAKEEEAHKIIIPKEGLMLNPNTLYLGRTNEYTETHGFVPMIEGRSSVGRLGMFIHVTAGFGDVGFCGYWTLEIFVVQPLVIYPDVEVCQIYYHDIDDNYETYKSGKYQHNTGIQTSKLWQELKGEHKYEYGKKDETRGTGILKD